MSTKKLSNMTDEELNAEAEKMAGERTDIRLKQLEVSREQEIRAALAAMSPETRRLIKITLEGGIAPQGEPEGVQA
jgi:hypothetical protein